MEDNSKCSAHEAAISTLTNGQSDLAATLEQILDEIGTSPDPVSGTQGSGIKALLTRVLSRLDSLDKRLDELNRASSTPAPTPSDSIVKRVSYWLLILYLAAQQVPTLIQTLGGKPASANAPALSVSK